MKNIFSSPEIPMLLAPLAGYSDAPCRRLACAFGADAAVTEMISAHSIIHRSKALKTLLAGFPGEKLLYVQLFGADPDTMAQAAEMLIGRADALDINMGCPVKKVIRQGAGSALMNTPETAGKIIKAVRRVWGGFLSVKIRLGLVPGDELYKTVIPLAADCGADMITVHGRYQKEMFSGTVHYSEIAEAVRLSSVPVTGNGDIIDFISLKKMLATGCRAVMIGRGAVGSPWIFYLLKGKTACLELKDTEVFPHSDFAIPGLDLLYLKRNTFSLNMAALIRVAMFHYNASADFYGEIKGLKEFRKHFARYIAGFPSLRDLRMEFFNSKTREESLQALHKYLAVCGEYFK